jgi:hypothetical protein
MHIVVCAFYRSSLSTLSFSCFCCNYCGWMWKKNGEPGKRMQGERKKTNYMEEHTHTSVTCVDLNQRLLLRLDSESTKYARYINIYARYIYICTSYMTMKKNSIDKTRYYCTSFVLCVEMAFVSLLLSHFCICHFRKR